VSHSISPFIIIYKHKKTFDMKIIHTKSLVTNNGYSTRNKFRDVDTVIITTPFYYEKYFN